MIELSFLLLPIAAYSGWIVGRKHQKTNNSFSLSRNYYDGLQYLLDEQPDKAIDAFIRLLDTSSETVETTLALGALFRHKGEVERAIRIHQELVNRPDLAREQRAQALLELGRDYMAAGLYDRAEGLLNELVAMGGFFGEKGQRYLIYIFERERDWEKAIDTAYQYQARSMDFMGREIAHYYCEKALIARERSDIKSALSYLKRALQHDRFCVRASLILADIEHSHGRYKSAIRSLKRIEQQDASFLPEVIDTLVSLHEFLGLHEHLENYLSHVLRLNSHVHLVLAKARFLERHRGVKEAMNFVTTYLRQSPSVRGIHYLLPFHLERVTGEAKDDLALLEGVFSRLAAQLPTYRCRACGFSSGTLHWQCPSCQKWASIKPFQEALFA